MKIYTIQRRDFLTYTDSQGFIIPKRDPEYSIFTDDEEGENCLWALEWMKRQFIKRMDIPLDRDLIWVWPDIYAYLSEKNDIDFSRHALFTFEVPAAYYKKWFYGPILLVGMRSWTGYGKESQMRTNDMKIFFNWKGRKNRERYKVLRQGCIRIG